MTYTLFIFLPVAVCIFWGVMHSLIASKAETYHDFLLLCIMCAVYLFSDACHATQPKGSPLDTGALIAALFAGPSIIPLIIMYLNKLVHKRRRHPYELLWVIIPTVLFTGGFLLYFLDFDERVNHAFNIITGPIFHTVLGVELLVLVGYIIMTLRYERFLPGNLISFLFKGKPISLTRLQIFTVSLPLSIMVLRIVLQDNLYTKTEWAAIVSATIIMTSLYQFGLNALFGMRTKIYWSDFRYMLRFNYGRENKSEVVERIMNELLDDAEEEALRRIQLKIGENLHIDQWRSGEKTEATAALSNHIFKAVSDSWEEDSLIARFQHLMIDQQLFLQPKLTLDEVADRLESNKTYISKLVNNTYNLGFPELINTLRVDYAEQYILSHKEAKQDEIAKQCGFLSASSFNTVFKKVTGLTPKMWIASRNND